VCMLLGLLVRGEGRRLTSAIFGEEITRLYASVVVERRRLSPPAPIRKCGYMRRHAKATRRDFINMHVTAPSAPPSYGPVSNHAEATPAPTRKVCTNVGS
jgi:hypothetical protein